MARSHEKLDFLLVGVIPSSVPFQLLKETVMAEREIRAFGADYGGFAAIYTPLLLAVEAGYKVRVCLMATCAKKYTDGTLSLDSRMEVVVDDFLEVGSFFQYPPHDLTVVAASQSDEGVNGAELVITSSLAPVLAMQDLYGSLHPTLARLKDSAQLDEVGCICVTDEFSASLMSQQFPDLSGRIMITGGPQFDKTVQIKEQWSHRRRQLREALAVKEDELVFLVAGQLSDTAEMLLLIEEAVEQAGVADRVKVIVRAHPRATDEDKRLLDTYYRFTPRKWFCDVERAMAPASEDLLPAADYVLSGYSTTNLYGILYGMVGVIYAGTSLLKVDLKREKGLERPAEVEAGAGWYVTRPTELAEVITAIEFGPASKTVFDVQQAQSRIAQYNDGKSAERVWQQMQNLLSD